MSHDGIDTETIYNYIVDDLPIGSVNINTNNGLLRIGYGSKGRGVFATTVIPPYTQIHIAPCIRVDAKEYNDYMKHTILEHYLFNDPRSNDKLLALGYGSLFNHSRYPNVDYKVDASNLCIVYTTGYKSIPVGDELCISYGSNLWFDDAEQQGNNNHEQQVLDDEVSLKDDEMDNGIPTFLGRLELDDNDD